MIDWMRNLLAGTMASLALAGSAWAQAPASAAAQTAPPAGFVAPAEPRPDETNANRGLSQPGNNAPLWRAVRNSGNQHGLSSLPGAEQGTLVQSFVQYPGSNVATAGEAWRQVRNRWIIPYGAAILVLMALALGLFYWKRGPLGGKLPATGRVIERFTAFERAAHLSAAACFVVLAASGLVMSFGKFFLLPVIGGTLFGWLSYALKTLHNFAGPLFAVALLVIIFTYVRDNLPNASDMQWLTSGGGLFGGKEPASHRFNAGEKFIFWGGIIVLGVTAVASGLVMDNLVPGMAYLRGDMQIAQMVHGVAAMLMMALFSVHAYMGVVGVKGAYEGMHTGYVDEGWAKENHELWYDDIKAGKIPAQRTPQAAPALGDAATRA